MASFTLIIYTTFSISFTYRMKINPLKIIKIFKYSAFTIVTILFSLLPTIKTPTNQNIESVYADTPPAPGSGDGSCGGGDGI